MKNRFLESDLHKMGLVKQPDGTYKKSGGRMEEPKPVTKKNREQNQLEMLQEQLSDVGNIILQWADKHISLNEWYSSKHWSHRNKAKEDWHEFFFRLFPKPIPNIIAYDITLKYNSNLDPSNTITMIKLCEDAMQEFGMIVNDTKKECKGIHLIPDELMKKNNYKILIKIL